MSRASCVTRRSIVPCSGTIHVASDAERAVYRMSVPTRLKRTARSAAGCFTLDQPVSHQQRQGRGEEAHALLAGVVGWFTEGFETADWQEAQMVVGELEKS